MSTEKFDDPDRGSDHDQSNPPQDPGPETPGYLAGRTDGDSEGDHDPLSDDAEARAGADEVGIEPAAEPAVEARAETPIPAAADPVPPEHLEDEAHEEERGWSFAARALAFLFVLIGGAALGIWAAPRLAPRLPAGLAPVAAWLTPGQSAAEAEIATLQSRLDAEVAALNDRLAGLPDAAAIESTAAGLVSTARDDLGGQIDALRSELAQPDPSDLSERVGTIETAVDGATAELASLRAQIASGSASLSQDATASIDTYRAELDGLGARVGQLSGAVSRFDSRLEEVAASAETRVAEAQTQAADVEQAAAAERDLSAAQADLALIRAALASGAPFEEPLAGLATSAGVTPPEGLSAAAATGVATPAALRTSFGDAAHQAIRASIVASAGDGLVARSRAFLEAQVASRSLTPQNGSSPDAVLSRAEESLRRDDLDAAIADLQQLPSEGLDAMQGWIAAARQRAAADAGLAELSASISTLN